MELQPEYPGRFGSIEHVRARLQTFYDWYCFYHHNDGLALFTPADVHFGRVPEIAANRQAALEDEYADHPERFDHGPPRVPLPPARAHINLRCADEPEPASNSRHPLQQNDLQRVPGGDRRGRGPVETAWKRWPDSRVPLTRFGTRFCGEWGEA
jgi:hypothetical protein